MRAALPEQYRTQVGVRANDICQRLELSLACSFALSLGAKLDDALARAQAVQHGPSTCVPQFATPSKSACLLYFCGSLASVSMGRQAVVEDIANFKDAISDPDPAHEPVGSMCSDVASSAPVPATRHQSFPDWDWRADEFRALKCSFQALARSGPIRRADSLCAQSCRSRRLDEARVGERLTARTKAAGPTWGRR